MVGREAGVPDDLGPAGEPGGLPPDVLLLPRDEAEQRLREAGYRVVSAADIGGVEEGESRVVRLRRAGPAGVELVLARCRPTV